MADQPSPEPVLDHAPDSAVVPDEPPVEAAPAPAAAEVTPVADVLPPDVVAPAVADEPSPLPEVVTPSEAGDELLDYREPELVLARGNIVSDGPGTVGHI